MVYTNVCSEDEMDPIKICLEKEVLLDRTLLDRQSSSTPQELVACDEKSLSRSSEKSSFFKYLDTTNAAMDQPIAPSITFLAKRDLHSCPSRNGGGVVACIPPATCTRPTPFSLDRVKRSLEKEVLLDRTCWGSQEVGGATACPPAVRETHNLGRVFQIAPWLASG